MNERIKLLAKQAGILTEVWHKDSLGNGYKVPNYEAEKFADLILFECIKLAVFKGDKETAQAIKEHFEIK